MIIRALVLLICGLALAGCGRGDDGPLRVGVIEEQEGSLFESGIRLSEGAQHVRAATQTGFVAIAADGGIVPALADRWIVTDDGRSYIFRLRDGNWPDGRELTAESVRSAFQEVRRQLRGTSLALDLAPIEDVRAMAGRVIEIRLKTPTPDFLRLLAQPEMALSRGEGGTGPMILEETESGGALAFKPPEERGLPGDPEWQNRVRGIEIFPMSEQQAVDAFDEGQVDVVLGGTIGAWPLADPGPLSRGTLRLDPAIGLFGLHVTRERGFLATPGGREAVAMAIDRNALIEPFNIGGWTPTTRIVPAGLPDSAPTEERWAGVSIEERRALASQRVAQYLAEDSADGEAVRLTVAMGSEPGLDILFGALARQMASIGIVLDRVPPGEAADFVLIDRIARYGAPRWFINQFNCSLRRGPCVKEADDLAKLSIELPEADMRIQMLAQAEEELTRANVFIPFGPPLRWSLVRSGVDGFAANSFAFHPLPEMATLPR